MPYAATSPIAPRVPVIAGFVVMLASVGLAATGRHFAGGEPTAPNGVPVAQRMLVFADMPDHGVGVYEGGKKVTEFNGEQGFLRGVLRGLNRTRKVHELPGDAPFTLAAYADGRLLLADPTTGVTLDLAAFGPTNEEVFARLLPVAEHPVPDRFQ